MPIDRFHAFGGAGVVQPPSLYLLKSFQTMKSNPILGIKLLVSFAISPVTQIKAMRVWRRFHKFSKIDPSCWLGVNAWCSSYGKLRASKLRIVIGKESVVRGILRLELGGEITIGADTYIGDDTILDSGNSIEIGDHTMLAHGIHVFDNDNHPLSWKDRLQQKEAYRSGNATSNFLPANAPIRIGNHVWIGFNAIITKGVSIGDRSIVAAGSVVTKDVAEDTLVAGNPARVIRSLDFDETNQNK